MQQDTVAHPQFETRVHGHDIPPPVITAGGGTFRLSTASDGIALRVPARRTVADDDSSAPNIPHLKALLGCRTSRWPGAGMDAGPVHCLAGW